MTRSKRPPIDPHHIDDAGPFSITLVAHAVGFHPAHLRRLIHQGRVSGFKSNGYDWRICAGQVKRLLQGQAYKGRVLPPPLGVPFEVWAVTPEQMMRMFPDWRPEPEGSGSAPLGAGR